MNLNFHQVTTTSVYRKINQSWYYIFIKPFRVLRCGNIQMGIKTQEQETPEPNQITYVVDFHAAT